MTDPKQKLREMIEVARNSTQGRLHIGHVDENLGHVMIDTEDLQSIAEVYRRWDQVHFCNAAPSNFIQLAEGALELVEALEYCASNDSMAVDPDGKYDYSSADNWKKMKAEEALRKFAGRMEKV